jgi:uncharacterized protein (DUF1778 family)
MTSPEKRRPGRPSADDPRQSLAIRVTAAERATLQAAADATSVGLTVYVREKALAAARRARHPSSQAQA